MSKKGLRKALFILLDIVSVYATLYISLGLRINFSAITPDDCGKLALTGGIMAAITVGVYLAVRLYNTIWEYASVDEAIKIILANVGILLAVYLSDTVIGIVYPRSLYPISIMVLTILTGGSRFAYRILRHLRIRYNRKLNKDKLKNTILIGSDEEVASLINFMQTAGGGHLVPVAIIGGGKGRLGTTIENIPILGTIEDLEEVIINKGVEMVLLAGDRIGKEDMTRILNICARQKCVIRKYDRFTLSKDKRNIVDIRVEDLLGREEVRLDTEKIAGYLRGKTIFVIGGGGSIGSELVRQIAGFNPLEIVVIDINENNAYLLMRELCRKYPDINIEVEIGSIRDLERMDYLFGVYKPQIVFHAAAHKHVPLMETAPGEAMKNNVEGTLIVAECAHRHNAEKMILISTDKAVNPTNVMGASKRIAEMVIQSYDDMSKTEYCAVRFGNVLGSSGSVIPLFKKQIEEGGPVTITHRDITRYFMTIPEACRLVMQAGAIAQGGEVFILNMGEQISITELAENMIRMQGLEPGVDIDIVYTGLRRGEKLHEELMVSDTDARTLHDKIFITKCGYADIKLIESGLAAARQAGNDEDKIKEIIKGIVPEYSIMK
ncbi:MAG: polysaccharide biosynthesis protein [Clostridia bacterium]|nr:polysaccharide biosynthesis protein [Clostridia bacterium]